MDLDFKSAQLAKEAPSSPELDEVAVYRAAHSPPGELSPSPRLDHAAGSPRSLRLRSISPPPDAAGTELRSGSAVLVDSDAGTKGHVYTRLQKELYPHLNF